MAQLFQATKAYFSATSGPRLNCTLDYPVNQNNRLNLAVAASGLRPLSQSSNKIVADFSSRSVLVAKLDGEVLYRLTVKIPWDPDLVTAASGSRFCIHGIGYTRWNSFINFGYVEGTPPSIEDVRVHGY
jgi:hypothetical protein